MTEHFGPYELIELLGRGGMGEVWRAVDTRKGRTVALKRLPAEMTGEREFEDRFRREAQAAVRLNDPHVIPIHDFGEIEGRLFLDMRLVAGDDLGAVVEKEGALEPARAVSVLEQVASALDAAHDEGLVHRDVKPSNILLTPSKGTAAPRDFVYLIDFGIATGAALGTRLTQTGLAHRHGRLHGPGAVHRRRRRRPSDRRLRARLRPPRDAHRPRRVRGPRLREPDVPAPQHRAHGSVADHRRVAGAGSTRSWRGRWPRTRTTAGAVRAT